MPGNAARLTQSPQARLHCEHAERDCARQSQNGGQFASSPPPFAGSIATEPRSANSSPSSQGAGATSVPAIGLRLQVRRGHELHALMIDREQRREMRQRRVVIERVMPVVEDQPMAVVARRQHRMVVARLAVAHQHETQIDQRESRLRAARNISRSHNPRNRRAAR